MIAGTDIPTTMPSTQQELAESTQKSASVYLENVYHKDLVFNILTPLKQVLLYLITAGKNCILLCPVFITFIKIKAM